MGPTLSLENVLEITVPITLLTSAYVVFSKEILSAFKKTINYPSRLMNYLKLNWESYNASKGKPPYTDGQLYLDFHLNKSLPERVITVQKSFPNLSSGDILR